MKEKIYYVTVQVSDGAMSGIVRHIVFWTILIVAFALTRVIYGGAWITDLMIVFLAILAMIALYRKSTGYTIDVPRDEMQAWLDAGMPKRWPL